MKRFLIIALVLLAGYASADTIRGEASIVYILAVDTSTDPHSKKTGDAANLTAHIDKDGGGSTPLTDTSATEVNATDQPGLYWFTLSASETAADVMAISCISVTANIVCQDAEIRTKDLTDEVVTDSASRTASKADVSALALATALATAAQTSYMGAIWIDTVNGSNPGSPSIANYDGAPWNPVDNITDAQVLAVALGVREYRISGGSNIVDPGQDYPNWRWVAQDAGSKINLLNKSHANSTFVGLTLTGSLGTGPITAIQCSINGASNMHGKFLQCGLESNFSVAAGDTSFAHCFSNVPGNAVPIITFASVTTTDIGFRLYSGGMEFSTMSANHTVSYDNPTGQLRIAASCTGGVITYRGASNLVDLSGGAVTVTALAAMPALVATAQADLDTITGTNGALLDTTATSPQLVDDTWDEQITTTDHNGANSAGKRLRQITVGIAHEGTAQGPGTGTNQLQLEASASSTAGSYDPGLVYLYSGMGAYQSNAILEYNETTKTITLERDWKVAPDNTTKYVVWTDPGDGSVNEGLARAGGASTITLNVLARAIDDTYKDQLIWITSGTGADQSQRIKSYNGTTKVATLSHAWVTQPDSTSAYRVLPFPTSHDAWDSPIADHDIADTFGANLQNPVTAGGGDASLAEQTLIKEGIAALASKDAAAPAYIGGTFDPATDSNEAIRDNMTGTGSGLTRVRRDDLADDNSSLYWTVTPGGAGISDGTVRAYVRSEYAAGGRAVRAATTTDDLGGFIADLWLDTGTEYTLEYQKKNIPLAFEYVTP